ncbi:MAG: hypothetical protein Harvfovirus37_9 [Harvfovirus sp.]|uniref:Uncharacterized protein n=1 Tax=Harvfovirus sp. TaxID=2487768 RepID=A0A3G5A2S1_9VIRU|nr:MAG: hypothetical protein Harvfovirus37_9 [Harvfovirus sp.]
MTKLYEDDSAMQYFYPNDEYSSWALFKKKRPYDGNATCPLTIIDFSWFNPESNLSTTELASLNDQEKKNQLYLICKHWSLVSDHYPTFIYKINLEKTDEPSVKKFIKKYKHKF